MNIAEEKRTLRETMRTELLALAPRLRMEKSVRLCRQIQEWIIAADFRHVMLFLPMADEVILTSLAQNLLEQQRPVLIPAIADRNRKMIAVEIHDLEADTEILREKYRAPRPALCANPKTLRQGDLVLVPGLAFDQLGNRLGRGWGCYDRFLAQLDEEVMTAGICFDFQVIPVIPTESYDMRVKKIICA